MTQDTQNRERLGTIVQKIRVEFEIVVEDDGQETDPPVDALQLDLLQQKISDYFVNEIAGSVLMQHVSSVTVSRGASGYRYFPVGQLVETDSPTPVRITLADLLS